MGSINRELIVSLISDIRESVNNAGKLVSKDFHELNLYERLALRYLVIELVEASATICVHILRSVYRVEVESYPLCFTRLGEVSLTPASLADRLARAARLRNLLVHRYWIVDDKRLYDAVREGLRDFEKYASIVEGVVLGEVGA